MELCLVRLSHRKERDKRITTHLFLSARILNVKHIYYTGDKDNVLEKNIYKVEKKFGMSIETLKHASNAKKLLHNLKQEEYVLVHLTMYGESYKERANQIKTHEKLAIIVGSEKVPGYVYEIADYNIAVGNQPHSEITAFALFAYEILNCKINEKYEDAEYIIKPSKRGKEVVKYDTSKM